MIRVILIQFWFVIQFGVLTQALMGGTVVGSKVLDDAGEVKYERIQGSFTWQQAKTDAENRGGHLATITSAEENNLIRQIASEGSVWIGGSDAAQEGQWQWVTGEPFSYSYWAGGEPNNCCGGEHYLQLYGGSGEWNDLQPGSGMPYIIEFSVNRPIIQINGDAITLHRQGTSFTDPGAIATDEEDGVIDVVAQGVVDVHTLGDFKITYSAIDSEGNAAKSVSRTVRIVDPEKPIIYLNGPAYMTHETGTQYIDQGAVAEDLNGETVDVTTTGQVDVFTLGDYQLIYTAVDAGERQADSLVRTVRVVDKNFKYLTYRKQSNGIIIIDCESAAAGLVSIPELIDGLPVTSIAANAFSDCSNITEVVLPETVINLGSSAFSNCSSLLTVNLPAGLTELPNYLFYQCSALNQITFPEGLNTIGHDAFNGCALEVVLLPDGLTTIGDRAFANNSQLTSAVLPGSLNQTPWECFSGCVNLKEVEMSEGINRIRGYGFRDTGLERIVIPSSVTYIEERAFQRCSQLTSVVMMGNAPEIQSDNVFSEVNENAKVYISSNSRGFADTLGSLPVVGRPYVQLNGDAAMLADLNGVFVDPGAEVIGLADETPDISVVGEVDPGLTGTYSLTYSAISQSGLSIEPATREVRVIDPLNPTISLMGEALSLIHI